MISKATIIFEDEVGAIRSDAYLTDPEHAMYVESEYGDLNLVRVVPTEQPDVYKIISGHFVLGNVGEGQEESVIHSLMQVLKEKSAYEFLTNVIMNVQEEIDFRELIVPGMTKLY